MVDKSESQSESQPQGATDGELHLALRAVMMPRDTNPHGTIFGGVLLSYIDQGGAVGARHAIAARNWPLPPLVTVAMDKVEFHQPVFVGDAVSFWTKVERIGTTSITMRVSVRVERNGQDCQVTDALVTYVAVALSDADSDKMRQPVPIRPS